MTPVMHNISLSGHEKALFLPYVIGHMVTAHAKFQIFLWNPVHLSTKTGHKNSKNSHENLNVRQTLSKR